jgi:hypothetical protein
VHPHGPASTGDSRTIRQMEQMNPCWSNASSESSYS